MSIGRVGIRANMMNSPAGSACWLAVKGEHVSGAEHPFTTRNIYTPIISNLDGWGAPTTSATCD
jgi:hypothetical protein